MLLWSLLSTELTPELPGAGCCGWWGIRGEDGRGVAQRAQPAPRPGAFPASPRTVSSTAPLQDGRQWGQMRAGFLGSHTGLCRLHPLSKTQIKRSEKTVAGGSFMALTRLLGS